MSKPPPPMRLTVPRDIAPADAVDLVAALREHIDVENAHWLLRKSVDPGRDLPFLQLIGGLPAWLPLSAAAAVFLTTLAKRAADATWDAFAKSFKNKEVKPLADVAIALGKAMEKAGPGTELIVGLSIPEPNWGTALVISETDPVKIVANLAMFVSHAEKIATTMEAEVAAGRAPLGRARISIEENGLVIRWRGQDDFVTYETWIS